MNSTAQDILDEILLLEPELKIQEPELRRIVALMLENRPDSALDHGFRSELRQRLDNEIKFMKRAEKSSKSIMDWIAPFLLGGVAFASIMIASPIGQYLQDMIYPNQTVRVPKDIALKQPEPKTTEKADDKAFKAVPQTSNIETNNSEQTGAIVAIEKPSLPPPPKKNIPKTTDRGAVLAFGLNIKKVGDHTFGTIKPSTPANTESSASPVSALGMGWDVTAPPMADSKMIAPHEPITYRYVYSWAIALELKDKNLAVLKRDKQRLSSPELDMLLSKFHFSGFDITTLEDFHLDSMSLSEDREYGLQANIDLAGGTINIYRNWTKWPQSKCQTDECFQKERVKISDIPSDGTLLEIASDFVRKHKIDLAHYGDPIINTDWKREYDRAPDKNIAYIPESISIIYPLIIDGKEVYEEYGSIHGLALSIDIRSKQVGEFSGIEKLDFIASDYATDGDFEHLKRLAESGGRSTPMGIADTWNSGKTIETSLRTPTVSYVKMSWYQNGQTDEYLVPSLVFPITDDPQGSRKNIIVPLIKEFQNL